MDTLINAVTAGMQIRVGTAGQQARRCSELLADFRPAADSPATLTRFEGVGERDVYNITSPFTFDGEQLIAGRVEQRSNEISEIVFFRRNGDVWTPRFSSPQFAHLQDPCITIIDGELILGGVRYPVMMPDGSAVWIMEFFRGSSLATLQRFLVGPAKMKDIRFCELDDGRIGVFSRPQGVKGGRGKIGFTIAETLEEVTAQMIQEAPLLEGQFAGGEWGAQRGPSAGRWAPRCAGSHRLLGSAGKPALLPDGVWPRSRHLGDDAGSDHRAAKHVPLHAGQAP